MKNSKIILLTIVFIGGIGSFFTSCSNDDDNNGVPEFRGLESGFLIFSRTSTNSFVRYTPELPTGTFDVSAGESFQEFTFRDQFRGQLYLNSISSTEGVEKFIVNEAEQVESVGNIATIGDAFPVRVENENTGYFADRNNLEEMTIFNPSTMQIIGGIDLSAAPFLEGADFQNYGGITIRGNDMFFPYRARASGQLIFDSLIYFVVDQTTSTYQKTIYLPGHINPRVFNNPGVDEQGNIYHLTSGDQSFPNVIKPSIVKIPAGSTDFDTSYQFRPIDALPGGSQLPIQLLDRFTYGANGIGYAIGSVEIPASVVQIISEAGGIQNLTQEQINTILALLASEPSAAWLRIDLNAQTVSVIDGIPLTSPFTNTRTIIDGDLYFGTTGTNTIYKYDPDTQSTTEIFNLTPESGDIFEIINLSEIR
ncbi:MAG: hypothetical protein AAF944_24560 [Bacteroidota bacterium]